MSSITNFVPKRREISAVTNDLEAEVTTTQDHGYELGQIVRLIVPAAYGMELNYVQAKILSITSDVSFVTDIDTTTVLPYVTPSTPPSFTQSQVVPMSGLEVNNISITG